jgi:DNA-directed RNA polymerase specialized sigma24 family protein
LTSIAQQQPSDSQERQQAISELVNLIERSHRLCRPSKSEYPIVQQIARDLRQQLLQDVTQRIDKYNPQSMRIKEWTNSLRDNALKKVLTDTLLKQIALAVQEATIGSKERWIALNLLVETIQMTGKLSRPKTTSLPLEVYKEIYREALQTTLLEICQKIDSYDSTREVMAWVNFLLNQRFKDALNKFMRHGITQLPRNSSNSVVSLDEPEHLESISTRNEACSRSQSLRELIEANPDNMFTEEHIQGQPNANFQSIVLDKIWGDKTWEEIAEKLQISSVQTLSSFYNRCLKKFRLFFLEYLQD